MLKDIYKIMNVEAKSMAMNAKMITFECLHVEIAKKDGDKSFYRLAKVRQRKTHDLYHMKCIKYETTRS